VGRIESFVLLGAGSGGCTHSVGGHSCCHIHRVLEFHNHSPLFKGLGRVAEFALLDPKVVTAVAIDEIPVKVGTFGAVGNGCSQFRFIACRQYAVDEFQHNGSYLVVNVKYHIFNCNIHIGGVL
jgi:hypothetical protein